MVRKRVSDDNVGRPHKKGSSEGREPAVDGMDVDTNESYIWTTMVSC